MVLDLHHSRLTICSSVLGPSVVFEAFEVCPRNKDVLAADNALQRNFPGMAAAVPLATFRDEGFITQLASFIENASIEPATEYTATAYKADIKLLECRDTSSPDVVTSLFMAFLEANGRRIAPTRLRKMTRDDICWLDAERPWRRLPYWLVLRVCVQLHLYRRHGGDSGRFEYKFLLVHLLSTFMYEMIEATSVDRLAYIKTKVCRRMAKIELDVEKTEHLNVSDKVCQLKKRLAPVIERHVSRVTTYIDTLWSAQKAKMRTRLPMLPQLASQEDMVLDLPVSGTYLKNVMSGYVRPKDQTTADIYASVKATLEQHKTDATANHARLLGIEQQCSEFCDDATLQGPKMTVFEAADMIKMYLRNAEPLYQGDVELQSHMLLQVMELWVAMDRAATTLYPLLQDYQPVIHPDMLDLLLLPGFDQMARLWSLQRYLRSRWNDAGTSRLTVFDDPVEGCFAQRYFDESHDSLRFRRLQTSIEEAAEARRLEKHREWKNKMQHYDDLARRIDQSTCIYRIDDNSLTGERWHDERACPRCKMLAEQQRMRIQIYEHPLPTNKTLAKVVIFELACPRAFSAYREATWLMYSSLALPKSESSARPISMLGDYAQLSPYSTLDKAKLTLASTTKSCKFSPKLSDHGQY